MVGPVVEQLSQTMSDKIKVAKLNVDENQEIAMRYGVRSIPSLLLFKAGKEIARTVGADSQRSISKIHRRITSKESICCWINSSFLFYIILVLLWSTKR